MISPPTKKSKKDIALRVGTFYPWDRAFMPVVYDYFFTCSHIACRQRHCTCGEPCTEPSSHCWSQSDEGDQLDCVWRKSESPFLFDDFSDSLKHGDIIQYDDQQICLLIVERFDAGGKKFLLRYVEIAAPFRLIIPAHLSTSALRITISHELEKYFDFHESDDYEFTTSHDHDDMKRYRLMRKEFDEKSTFMWLIPLLLKKGFPSDICRMIAMIAVD